MQCDLCSKWRSGDLQCDKSGWSCLDGGAAPRTSECMKSAVLSGFNCQDVELDQEAVSGVLVSD